ncbi:MAG: thiosulfate oxidation carrier protein SoxY [Gammaproteobacteria bacterium]|nr:thiosulfate oxidation carrier protein SoxY [Gammaproteobacteria bacterium]
MSKQGSTQTFTRRQVLIAASGLALAGFVSRVRPAIADAASTQEAIKKVIGGKDPKPGRIKLKLPEIAENGNTVPVSFSVDSPMTKKDYVKAVHLFAEANPRPNVGSFYFSPTSGKATASTRMRLLKTQNIVALAEMNDGSVYMTKTKVKVTIGGCGG